MDVKEVVLEVAPSSSTGFEEAVSQEVCRRLRSAAADIRRRARKFGDNIEGAMLDIAMALEEASEAQQFDQEPAPGHFPKWEKLQRARKHHGVPEWSVFTTPPLNAAKVAAGPKSTSRCCNAPISSCDGKPMCLKCRLTGKV